MSAQKISELTIPVAENAICFFWMSPSIAYDVIQKKLDESGYTVDAPIYKFILDSLGFCTIKGEFAWDKKIIGLGSWNRNQHENCFIAIKGKMPTPLDLHSSIISEKRTKHSKKPDSIYGIIEKMYPKRNYLELFARKKHSEKWAVFGNQLK